MALQKCEKLIIIQCFQGLKFISDRARLEAALFLLLNSLKH